MGGKLATVALKSAGKFEFEALLLRLLALIDQGWLAELAEFDAAVAIIG